MMDVSNMRHFGDLLTRKRNLEKQVRELSGEMEALQRPLQEQMINEGLDSLPINLPDGGKMTLYLHRQMWARAKEGDRGAVVAALKMAGLEDLVKEDVNLSTLSCWVRETLAGGDSLPPTVNDTLDVEMVTQIRGRRSSGSAGSMSAQAAKTLNQQGG